MDGTEAVLVLVVAAVPGSDSSSTVAIAEVETVDFVGSANIAAIAAGWPVLVPIAVDASV